MTPKQKCNSSANHSMAEKQQRDSNHEHKTNTGGNKQANSFSQNHGISQVRRIIKFVRDFETMIIKLRGRCSPACSNRRLHLLIYFSVLNFLRFEPQNFLNIKKFKILKQMFNCNLLQTTFTIRLLKKQPDISFFRFHFFQRW